MTNRPVLTLTTLLLTVAAAACTGDSDAVDVPGAQVAGTDDATAGSDAPATTDTVTSPPPAPTTVTPPTTAAPTTTVVETTAPPTTAAPTTTAARNPDFLRFGDEDPRIGIIQLKLSVLGYLPPNSDTGVFDSATNSAVLAFQGDYGLIVDGIIGPQTERAISAAAESINPEQ